MTTHRDNSLPRPGPSRFAGQGRSASKRRASLSPSLEGGCRALEVSPDLRKVTAVRFISKKTADAKTENAVVVALHAAGCGQALRSTAAKEERSSIQQSHHQYEDLTNRSVTALHDLPKFQPPNWDAALLPVPESPDPTPSTMQGQDGRLHAWIWTETDVQKATGTYDSVNSHWPHDVITAVCESLSNPVLIENPDEWLGSTQSLTPTRACSVHVLPKEDVVAEEQAETHQPHVECGLVHLQQLPHFRPPSWTHLLPVPDSPEPTPGDMAKPKSVWNFEAVPEESSEEELLSMSVMRFAESEDADSAVTSSPHDATALTETRLVFPEMSVSFSTSGYLLPISPATAQMAESAPSAGIIPNPWRLMSMQPEEVEVVCSKTKCADEASSPRMRWPSFGSTGGTGGTGEVEESSIALSGSGCRYGGCKSISSDDGVVAY